MAQDTSDTEATWAAVQSALMAHLEATGWLTDEMMLGDYWVVAQCAYLDGNESTRYYHGGPYLPAHRALGLLAVSKQMLSESGSREL